LAAVEISLVDADNRDRHFAPTLVDAGDGRAEKDLVPLVLPVWVDNLGALQPLGQESDTPVKFVQATLEEM
jgi:hypothetical protein